MVLAPAITIVVLAAVTWLVVRQNQALGPAVWTSGWMLAATVLLLAAYNIRKKFPFLPALGASSLWMRVHIWAGLGSSVVFILHVGLDVPHGVFERVLAAAFVMVFSSGIYGLVITRRIPRRLAAIGREVVFERIPQLRRGLARQAAAIVGRWPAADDVLRTFYARHLETFFGRPRRLSYVLWPSRRHCQQLVDQLGQLDRYLSEDRRTSSRQLADLVRQKDDLDYQWVMQGRLKLWLVVHIVLTYALVVLMAMHVVIVHVYAGGAP